MANEVVLHGFPNRVLKCGDVCQCSLSGYQGQVFLVIKTAMLEEGVAKAAGLATGSVHNFNTDDLTPLGPCRIEVTPC